MILKRILALITVILLVVAIILAKKKAKNIQQEELKTEIKEVNSDNEAHQHKSYRESSRCLF